METNARIVAKALCWQASGLAVMAALGYVFTGSVSQGGALAFTSMIIGLVSYVAHEKLWARVQWGRIIGEAREMPAHPAGQAQLSAAPATHDSGPTSPA